VITTQATKAFTWDVSADEQVNQSLLIRFGRLRQVQHVTVDVQPNFPVRSPATRQPCSGHADDGTQAMSGAANCDQQAASRDCIQSPGAWRRLTGRDFSHIVHIELQEFLTEGPGQLIQLIRIRALLSQMKTQLLVH